MVLQVSVQTRGHWMCKIGTPSVAGLAMAMAIGVPCFLPLRAMVVWAKNRLERTWHLDE